jgi:hypothetical protein
MTCSCGLETFSGGSLMVRIIGLTIAGKFETSYLTFGTVLGVAAISLALLRADSETKQN